MRRTDPGIVRDSIAAQGNYILPKHFNKLFNIITICRELYLKERNNMSDYKRYPADEIVRVFAESDLDAEFKAVILARYDAILQGMHNAVSSPVTAMIMSNTYGDVWVEEHNRVVTEYQKVYN